MQSKCPPDSPAIDLADVHHAFGQTVALRDLSLVVPKGCIFGLLGPNGAGKSTTVRILLGLIRPGGGTCRVLGLDPVRKGNEVRRQCGVLLEDHGLYERLTALENIEFHARVQGISRSTTARRSQALLTEFGLWERRDEFVRYWSKGMRQKLALVRALLHRPALLILDEPVSGLDPLAANVLYECLGALKEKEGTTILLCTHHLDEAERVCDSVGVLRQGELVALGPPRELGAQEAGRITLEIRGSTKPALHALASLPEVVKATEEQPGLIEVMLSPDADAAELARSLIKGGILFTEFRRSESHLTEVFRDLMSEDHAS